MQLVNVVVAKPGLQEGGTQQYLSFPVLPGMGLMDTAVAKERGGDSSVMAWPAGRG